MSLLVVIAGVMLLSVPAVAIETQLTAEDKVRMSCAAIACGSAVVAVGLALTASPLLILWHDGEPIGEVSHLSPGGRWAWAAGATLVVLAATVASNAVRATLAGRRRVHAASLLGADVHHHRCGVAIRIVPIEDILALATPSPAPHVVVSQTLHDLLDSGALDAVLAHEASHLRLRHDRHLFLLSFYLKVWGWLPRVDRIVAELRHEVEKWADNSAVRCGATNPQTLAAAIETVARASSPVYPNRKNAQERAASLRTIAPCHPPVWQPLAMTALTTVGLLGSAYAATHSLIDLAMIVSAIH